MLVRLHDFPILIMQSNRGEAEEEEEEREEKKKGTTERKSAPEFPRFEKLIRNTDRILG